MLRDCRIFCGPFSGIAQSVAIGVAVLPIYREYTRTVVSEAQIDPSSCSVPDGSATLTFSQSLELWVRAVAALKARLIA